MDEFTSGVAQVVTLANIIIALIGGALAGYFLVGVVAGDPTWVSPVATPKAVGILVGSYSIAIGGLFYLGQTIASLVDGDPGWPRIASRFVVYVVFCLALGAFTWLRLVWHIDHRRREARLRAQREIDATKRRNRAS